jgi:hypothetical protein
MKSAIIFEEAKTRTLALGLIIVLGVGIAMPFVVTFMPETGSVDIFQDAFARRANVDFQSQTNSGNNCC